MKKIQTPARMRIHGRMREVVAIDLPGKRWTERLPDGTLVHHAGRLISAQEPGSILDEPKICKACKQPAITATARGRAYHPTCEGWTTTLPDEQIARIVHGVARDLGAEVLDERGRR